MFGILRALFAALFLLVPSLGHAQSANSIPAVNKGAQDFAIQFLDGWSRPNSQALPYIQSRIDDPINFYGKTISRDAYMKTQEAFAIRWPNRAYQIEFSSLNSVCNTAASECDVTGIEYWNNFSPARHMLSTGSANFSLSLRPVSAGKNPSWLITAESGSVISSELDKAIDNSDVLLGPSSSSNFTISSPNSSDQPQLVTNAAIQKAGCVSPDGPIQHENCNSVSELDLTEDFHTKDRTVLAVTQAASDFYKDFPPPPLSFCFIHQNQMQCQYGLNPNPASGYDSFQNTTIIHPTAGAYRPVLLGTLYAEGGAGCGNTADFVWAYNPANNSFSLIWNRPSDCHTTLKFETSGPLAGDMIAVDGPATAGWPWPYGLEVYKFTPPDQLKKILYFVGRAGQGGKYVTGPDGAITTDMPEILQRLGISN